MQCVVVLKRNKKTTTKNPRLYFLSIANTSFREIEQLAKGSFPKVDIYSKCRCPESHPTLHKITGVDKQRNLKCENRQGDLTNRLNDNAHPGVYMVDLDNDTYWDSGPVRTATITITLKKIVQVI